MKRYWFYLILFLLSACMVRKERRPAAMAVELSLPIETVTKTATEEFVLRNMVSEMKVLANEAMVELVSDAKVNALVIENKVVQQKIVQQKGVKQEAKKKSSAQKVFSISRSELELKKPLISGPSQFDSRVEPYILNLKMPWQKKIHENASSIAIVVEKDKMHAVTDSTYQLEISMTLQTRYKLCPNEPFANQPVIGIGTAFLAGKNLMITAGHVFSSALENYVIIFGFEMLKGKGAYNTIIHKSNVFHPKRIRHTDQDLDMTIFEVIEDVNRRPLKIAEQANPVLHTEIYMIGYPSGLPQKVALNADVQENKHPQYFYTSLDAFQGNSGSPVFDMSTHQVIGILVSGEVDYIWNGSCNKSSLCRFPYCKGEKVMKIPMLSDYSIF